MAVNVAMILPGSTTPTRGRFASVPRVKGKTEEEAVADYKAVDLLPAVVQVEPPPAGTAPGRVFAQEPEADRPVARRSRATIFVAFASPPTPADINARFDRVDQAVSDVKGDLKTVGDNVVLIRDAVVPKPSKTP